MGAGGSKQSAGASQHVFEASGARTTFSGDLVTTLQDSTGSDSTRSAALEQRIQARITEQLEKLDSEESDRIKSLIESANSDSPQPDSSSSEEASEDNDPSLFQKLTGRGQDKDKTADLSNSSVSKEIAELKKKLEGRKKVEQPDAGVLKAKEQLVSCLRANDRRPLDCWKEKDAFKKEVARLEKTFVEKTVR